MSNQKHAARASAPKYVVPGSTPDVEGTAMRDAYPPGMASYPFAYAIVEGPPGQWTAVCLEGVTARAMEKLEPNGDAEPEVRAMLRLQRAIEMRTIGKRWSKP